MADTRGAVLIVVALIGAAATVVAAMIANSNGDEDAPPAPPSDVASTPTLTIQPGPAGPEPSTAAPVAPPASNDLGLSRPITRPDCDGRYVVFVGSAVDPPNYRAEVQNLLNAYPDSEYLRTSDTCSSLRPRSNAGDPIYGVYYGPFATREQACHERDAQGGESYVKILDTVTDSNVIIEC